MKQRTFNVNSKNFFTQGSKFLHFFQPEDQGGYLYVLDISKGVQGHQFLKIALEQQMPIPSFHKSIATPLGEIYLIGGRLQSGKKSDEVYSFDFDTKRLKLVGKLKEARSSHTLVYLNGCIFVIGGLAENQLLTNSVESVNVTNNSVQSRAPLR